MLGGATITEPRRTHTDVTTDKSADAMAIRPLEGKIPHVEYGRHLARL
jgi:hypothetical protein